MTNQQLLVHKSERGCHAHRTHWQDKFYRTDHCRIYKITLGNFFSVLYSGQKSVLIEGIKRMCNTTITLKFGHK